MRRDGREELLQPTLGAGQGPSRGRKGPAGAGVRAWVGAAGPQLCKHGRSGCSRGGRASGLRSQAPEVTPAVRPGFTQRCWDRAWQDPPLAPDTTGRLMVVGPSWPPPLRDNVPCYAPGVAAVPSVQRPQPTPAGCPGCCSLALGAFPEMRGAGVCWVGHAGHWWPSVSDIPGSAGQSTPSSQGCRAGDSGGASLGRLRPGQC